MYCGPVSAPPGERYVHRPRRRRNDRPWSGSVPPEISGPRPATQRPGGAATQRESRKVWRRGSAQLAEVPAGPPASGSGNSRLPEPRIPKAGWSQRRRWWEPVWRGQRQAGRYPANGAQRARRQRLLRREDSAASGVPPIALQTPPLVRGRAGVLNRRGICPPTPSGSPRPRPPSARAGHRTARGAGRPSLAGFIKRFACASGKGRGTDARGLWDGIAFRGMPAIRRPWPRRTGISPECC